MTSTCLASLLLAASLLGQAETLDPATASAPERLDYMQKSIEPLRFTLDGREDALRLLPEPAFRLGKQPADLVEEGAIFLWVDDVGRPQATVQVFNIRLTEFPHGLWLQEFVSLAPGTFTAHEHGRTSWAPTEPGVSLQTIPRAPRPAESPAQRLRQMQALARDFRASDYFKDKAWTELRLLPKPIARFGKPGGRVLDGALFAFVTGTDPEVFLFVEARDTKDGPQWQYAFAPMTCWQVRGSLNGKPLWEQPNRHGAKDTSKTYFVRRYEP